MRKKKTPIVQVDGLAYTGKANQEAEWTLLSSILLFLILLLVQTPFQLKAQEADAVNESDTTAFLPATYQGQNLDLSAVLAVFQDAKGLEDFEKELNKRDGINNLDLNGDSIVDYIRVMEKEEGEYRVIVMQAIVAENEFQDVAYINIKRSSEQDIQVQAQGDPKIYGENYYVSPQREVHVHVHNWPVWSYMYVPNYRVYYSPYYWGYYPRWWGRYYFRPYPYYRSHVVVYHRGFYCHRRVIVRRPARIYYPRHSRVIVTTPVVVHTGQRNPAGSNAGSVGSRSATPGTRSGNVEAPRSRTAKPGAPSGSQAKSRAATPQNSEQARPAQTRQAKPGAPTRTQTRTQSSSREAASTQATPPRSTRTQAQPERTRTQTRPATRPTRSRQEARPSGSRTNTRPATRPSSSQTRAKKSTPSRAKASKAAPSGSKASKPAPSRTQKTARPTRTTSSRPSGNRSSSSRSSSSRGSRGGR
jgi:hypothetical protein